MLNIKCRVLWAKIITCWVSCSTAHSKWASLTSCFFRAAALATFSARSPPTNTQTFFKTQCSTVLFFSSHSLGSEVKMKRRTLTLLKVFGVTYGLIEGSDMVLEVSIVRRNRKCMNRSAGNVDGLGSLLQPPLEISTSWLELLDFLLQSLSVLCST